MARYGGVGNDFIPDGSARASCSSAARPVCSQLTRRRLALGSSLHPSVSYGELGRPFEERKHGLQAGSSVQYSHVGLVRGARRISISVQSLHLRSYRTMDSTKVLCLSVWLV